MGATTIATRIKTWVTEVLTSTDQNAEFDNAINEINSINNAKFTSNLAGRLVSTKIVQGVIGLSTFLRAEHSSTGGHSAFSANNMDHLFVFKLSDTKIQTAFHRVNLFPPATGDNPSTRTTQLFQSTSLVSLPVDITTTGAGGRDVLVSLTDSTWYTIWVIWGDPAGPDLFLTSDDPLYANLTLPSGYTHALLIGRTFRNADSKLEKPEAVVGANAERYVVPFDVAHNYADPGYQIFGSRSSNSSLVMQWGTQVVGATSTEVVTLPIEYRSLHLIAIATRGTLSANQAQVESWYSEATSTTQLTIVNSTAASITFHWFSIGF